MYNCKFQDNIEKDNIENDLPRDLLNVFEYVKTVKNRNRVKIWKLGRLPIFNYGIMIKVNSNNHFDL